MFRTHLLLAALLATFINVASDCGASAQDLQPSDTAPLTMEGDLASQMVVTHSGSIYRLVGPRGEGEPTLHQLLHLCSAQWQWGRGPIMGVLEVFY